MDDAPLSEVPLPATLAGVVGPEAIIAALKLNIKDATPLASPMLDGIVYTWQRSGFMSSLKFYIIRDGNNVVIAHRGALRRGTLYEGVNFFCGLSEEIDTLFPIIIQAFGNAKRARLDGSAAAEEAEADDLSAEHRAALTRIHDIVDKHFHFAHTQDEDAIAPSFEDMMFVKQSLGLDEMSKAEKDYHAIYQTVLANTKAISGGTGLNYRQFFTVIRTTKKRGMHFFEELVKLPFANQVYHQAALMLYAEASNVKKDSGWVTQMCEVYRNQTPVPPDTQRFWGQFLIAFKAYLTEHGELVYAERTKLDVATIVL